MALLSSPITELKDFYDAIVIGSGYGGAVTASLLARAKAADGAPLKVCVLERGREIPVGRFPNDPISASADFQVVNDGRQLVGKEDALYWMHTGTDLSVFHGCGLGGTSLVNANVALPPTDRVWDDPHWPKALLADREGGLKLGFARAKYMLGATPYPGAPSLKKYAALQRSAAHLNEQEKVPARVYYPDINVNFQKRLNHVGVEQEECSGCGDCVSGCNVGAKNTLMMNYLPDAKNHGAEIYCSVRVNRVEASGQKWRVYFQPVGFHRDRFHADELFVEAGLVVLSAGALGSTEILLKSKERGLASSDRVGERFSGNGDVLGFGYNTDQEINGIGNGERDTNKADSPGPCITGIIDCRYTERIEDAHVIEEGVIPGAVAALLPGPMRLVAGLIGTDTDSGAWDAITEAARTWASALPGGAYRGAFANTQTFLIMSHDSAGGKLELKQDNVTVSWPGAGDNEHFKMLHGRLLKATEALGGTYLPSPTFNKAFGYDLVTVHPLGGCSMGEDAATGATNHKGQVFSDRAGDTAYSNLYVSDGSILPCSVGVNPLLTISAIAERNARLLLADHGWSAQDTLPGTVAKFDGRQVNTHAKNLRFTEKMAGHCSTIVLDTGAFSEAEKNGKANASPCNFVLTIVTADAERMFSDPEHPAQIVGTVYAPALSREAMTVQQGAFNLFVADSVDPALKRMRYRMQLRSVEGTMYYFDGYKLIRDQAGFDLWSDTTTLYVTIHQGKDAQGPVVCQGILHISEPDFAVQLTTVAASDELGVHQPLTVAKFGTLFAQSLWDTYAAKGVN